MFLILDTMLIGHFKIMIPRQIAFTQFLSQIEDHFPANLLLEFVHENSFIFPKIVIKNPLKNAILIFIVCFSNVREANIIDGIGYAVQRDPASTQRAMLQEVAMLF